MVEERLLNANRNLSGDSDELYIPSLNNFPSLQSKIEENKWYFTEKTINSYLPVFSDIDRKLKFFKEVKILSVGKLKKPGWSSIVKES